MITITGPRARRQPVRPSDAAASPSASVPHAPSGLLHTTIREMLAILRHADQRAWQRGVLDAVLHLTRRCCGLYASLSASGDHHIVQVGTMLSESEARELLHTWLDGGRTPRVPGRSSHVTLTLSEDIRPDAWSSAARGPIRALAWDVRSTHGGDACGVGLGFVRDHAGGRRQVLDYLYVFDEPPTAPIDGGALQTLPLLLPALFSGSTLFRQRALHDHGVAGLVPQLPFAAALLDRRSRRLYPNEHWLRAVHARDHRLVETTLLRAAVSAPWAQLARTGAALRLAVGSYVISVCGDDSQEAGTAMSLALLKSAVESGVDWRARAQAHGLPPGMAAVAGLIAEGKTNEEIAAALDVTPSAARRQTERLLARLGVKRRSGVASKLTETPRTSERDATTRQPRAGR